jgi:hypothetical protein
MSSEEHVSRLVKRVSEIMYKNPSLFPIVEEVFIAAKHYKVEKKKIEFYVRQTLETRVGLYFVVRTKYNSFSELRWTSEPDFLSLLEKEIIKSSILVYAKSFPDREDYKKYQKILEKESLK